MTSSIAKIETDKEAHERICSTLDIPIDFKSKGIWIPARKMRKYFKQWAQHEEKKQLWIQEDKI